MKPFLVGVGAAIFPVGGVALGIGLGLLNVWWWHYDFTRSAIVVGTLAAVFGAFGFYVALRYLDFKKE